MATVVVDTDVVSYIFKQDTRAVPFRRHLNGHTLVISFMTLAEQHAWALQYRWGKQRRSRLARYLAQYVVHYSDADLCELWAEARNQARLKGRPIGAADAWIAASALALAVPLVTNNPTDYAGVTGLSVLSAAAP